MRKYETTKLFWGKYLYKISIRNVLAPCFRGKNFSYAREVLDGLQHSYEKGEPLIRTVWLKRHPVSEQQFLDAKILYSKFKKFDDFLLRIEMSSMNVYSNDKDWLLELGDSVAEQSVESFWEPDTKYQSLLDQNTIIVPEHNGYDYKVTLGNKSGDSGFANFAKTNPKLVKVGPILMEEMENKGYVNNMYFYARDEKVLQLCSLLLSNIRRIDKLVVKSNIDK